MPEDDERELRTRILDLLTQHVAQTDSELAGDLLAQIERNPEAVFSRFTRLIPRGYSRVLEIRVRANEAGVDPDGDQVWNEILEATHG